MGGPRVRTGRARELEFPELSPKWGWQNDEEVGKSWRDGMGCKQVVGAIWDIEGKDGRVSSSTKQYGGNNMGLQNNGGCKMLVKGGIWWEGGIEETGVR